ncbi:hypothetical protein OAH88_06550, partial [Candidatus Pelagibacter sp.]|nr:hypothetical protein [Candidatus Pelagibacter sp.]
MKIIIKALILISFIFFSKSLYAATNIVYIDMNIIYNQTKVGKLIFSELEEINKKNISKFQKDEEILKKEEQVIFSQKNILSSAEYDKKVLAFKKKVDKYKSDRDKSIDELK